MVKAVYIHIPFCRHICTYCDFAKMYKHDKWIEDYLIELKKEIIKNYKGEKLKTLYIGGGTPSSLSIKQLEKLFDILKIFKLDNAEITFEANSEDLTKEKLEFLKNKINRLSIGIQTFNPKYLKVLGRSINIDNIKEAKNYFNNINIDLMYNFKDQSLKEVKQDIDEILELDVSHISTYSLILEKNTKLYIDGYKIEEDDTKDEYIDSILTQNGYKHYEISNYAKEGFESKHNQTYWNNEEYYGFGLGAAGYIDSSRYENTRSLTKYLKGNHIYESHKLDLNEKLQNEFILGFRKIYGINKQEFYNKYNFNIKEIPLVKELLKEKLLLENENIYINPKYIYISNEILVKFLIELK